MRFQVLPLEGPKLIFPTVFKDDRGFFFESYKTVSFALEGIREEFVQDNHSFSKYGTLRGMHFQSAPGQAKLVRVVSGEIFDVVVDIRRDSPHFGKWTGVRLDSSEHAMLYVPTGFAHGFCVLSEAAHVLYKVSSFYHAETEKGFRYDDPDVGIDWPIHQPLLSERDRSASDFAEVCCR